MNTIFAFLMVSTLLFSLAGCGGLKSSDMGVALYYEENAQVELFSPPGTRVLIDIANPYALLNPAGANDILLTTHSHGDHLNTSFADSFPGKQIRIEKGSIQQADVNIQSIQGSHNSTPPPDQGSNYIYIVDMGSMRFVHFGDLGQDSLTPEQLTAIGKVDVAFMQLANSYSSMDVTNKKGFNLMDQVKPRLIIPTHIDESATQYAIQKWPAYYWDQKSLALSPASLGSETRILFLGDLSKAVGKANNLPLWGSK